MSKDDELITYDSHSILDLPSEVGENKNIMAMRGLHSQQTDTPPNKGRMAQLCVILAIRDLKAEGNEELERVSHGKSTANVDTRDFGPDRKNGIDALFFSLQHLWPKARDKPTELLQEIQYLINHGAELLGKMSRKQIHDALVDVLTHEEEE